MFRKMRLKEWEYVYKKDLCESQRSHLSLETRIDDATMQETDSNTPCNIRVGQGVFVEN